MANLIPLAIADFETSLSVAISAGATSLTLSSATDDDGEALPAGKYCFTVNNGSSNKQYLLGQLNGTDVTSVVSVSRQGVETSGAAFAARAGSPIIISDFATIQRVADILRGQLALDGGNPVGYDAEPTLADRKELATVGYVLDTVTGGTVNFDSMTVAGNAGEAVVAGNLVYFKTSDQEWYLVDADTAATLDAVQIGIALGTGSDGVAITGGVQITGTWTTAGLTAGSLYYASNTAGAIASSAGTNSKVVGLAFSTTKLLLLNQPAQGAFAGAGERPSISNKFLTQNDVSGTTLFPGQQIVTFTSSGTWTKDSGLKYVVVEVVGGGGGGGAGFGSGSSPDDYGGGGGGGGYSKKIIQAGALGATETVTVGTGGSTDTAGVTSSFGAHCSATGGVEGHGGNENISKALGGVGSGGDINVRGQSGGTGGSTDTVGVSGFGGSSFMGGGAGPAQSNDVTGFVGGNYGGGGSGGTPDSNANNAGGAGADGIVIVTEYYV